MRFDAGTSLWFRRNIMRPFYQYLKDGAEADVAPSWPSRRTNA